MLTRECFFLRWTNLVQFILQKTEKKTAKKTLLDVSPDFENTPFKAAPSMSILGLNISSDCPRESKKKAGKQGQVDFKENGGRRQSEIVLYFKTPIGTV